MDLAYAVEEKLRNTPGLRNSGLRASVEKEGLVLFGRVPTYYLKQLAQEAVIRLLPVSLRLINHINVVKETIERVVTVQECTETQIIVENSMENFGKQRELEHIDPTQIKLNDDKSENSIFRNARTTLQKEEMATNRESIRKLGLLKPLIIRPLKNDPDGYPYQLVCGSRRLRNILKLRQQAVAILKEQRPFTKDELCYCPETAEWHPATEVYSTVKCFVRDCDDETAIRINIAENLEHSKVPEMDLMEFCQELVDLKKKDNSPRYTRAEIADLCNRSESWVSLTLELNNLPDRVRQMMYEDRVTRTAALAFLQTERDKIDEVIEVGENIVREEKLTEAKVAEEELRIAEIELSDAQNDVLIHEMMENKDLMEMAKKREGSQRKRVSAASEKRDQALKEAESPNLTADVINQANLIVEGAKKEKTKPKAMPVKNIRNMYSDFKDYIRDLPCKDEFDPKVAVNVVVNSIFEAILGHRAYLNMEDLLSKYLEDDDFLYSHQGEDGELITPEN